MDETRSGGQSFRCGAIETSKFLLKIKILSRTG